MEHSLKQATNSTLLRSDQRQHFRVTLVMSVQMLSLLTGNPMTFSDAPAKMIKKLFLERHFLRVNQYIQPKSNVKLLNRFAAARALGQTSGRKF
ncbi:hypothetical protein CTI12_AA051100 [Artemisia annua]|uniref:Uncharacterized protein n=1 Tax=Artemisia annua TaxID=35608 RepID=A0A2U1QBC7_ARTAN|nr:hypothetical protein CTI12_AA051100 [Artemisia annua]